MWDVTAADIQWVDALYPLAKQAMQRGYLYAEPQLNQLPPESVSLLASLRAGFWWHGRALIEGAGRCFRDVRMQVC